ncbi:TPA: MFS transporter, partial [Vibrio antiquarius]
MTTSSQGWRTPQNFLLLISIIVPIAFSTWMALLNNFVIEKANFDGADIGLLQSVREVPGFLAFTAVFVLLFIREQRFMLVSLAMLTLGTALTGYFPTLYGLLFTTLLMSTGFHYFETLKQSLSLQWLSKEEAPEMLGKFISVGALASLFTYGAIWVSLEQLKLDFKTVYLMAGGLGFVLILVMAFAFPQFKTKVPQNKKLILRKRYWLYYALTFMSGARRQIFTVFAGFLMVEKFGYSAADITLLFLINYVFNFLFAKRIGRFIGVVGERKALMFEYVGLIFVFVGYGLVQTAEWAAALYVVDHLFFALALAIKTYFQKIADPADMASTAGVAFTINHIAAVVIPVTFGVIWLVSPASVFYIGAGMAAVSLLLSLNIPAKPEEGNETR